MHTCYCLFSFDHFPWSPLWDLFPSFSILMSRAVFAIITEFHHWHPDSSFFTTHGGCEWCFLMYTLMISLHKSYILWYYRRSENLQRDNTISSSHFLISWSHKGQILSIVVEDKITQERSFHRIERFIERNARKLQVLCELFRRTQSFSQLICLGQE